MARIARSNGRAPLPRQPSGTQAIAYHRPTRYALIMRREKENASRRARGAMQLPGVFPGSCAACDGLGVINHDRQRCSVCLGSGER